MARKDNLIKLNVVGVSGNPKVLQAISKAAKSMNQFVQLGTDLSELPVLLDQIDATSHLLVFLDHPPEPDAKLIQAAEQIYRKDAIALVWILAEKDPGRMGDELHKAGLNALLTPPFDTNRFREVISSASSWVGS